MKNFAVYRHPQKGYKAIKAGFSWPAFFSSCLWLMSKKLWPQFIWFTAAYLGLSYIESLMDNSVGGSTSALELLTMSGDAMADRAKMLADIQNAGQGSHGIFAGLLAMLGPDVDVAQLGFGMKLAYFVLYIGYAAIWIIPALKGNAWWGRKMEGQGYDFKREIPAKSEAEAIQKEQRRELMRETGVGFR